MIFETFQGWEQCETLEDFESLWLCKKAGEFAIKQMRLMVTENEV